MSKVLVVTPAYCTEKNQRLPLLLQTIYWMQRQSHDEFLHVVVDDGSTDQTPEVLDQLASQVPRFEVLHKNRGGQSEAINFGVETKRTEYQPDYITWVHSDDILPPTSLEKRVVKAEKTSARATYGDSICFYENPRIPPELMKTEESTEEEFLRACLNHEHIPYHTVLWAAECYQDIGGFDPDLRSAEDWDITLRTAQCCQEPGSLAFVHDVVYAYRRHARNLRITNVRSGRKLQAYRRILGKHFGGLEYSQKISNTELGWSMCCEIIRGLLPEPARPILRRMKQVLGLKTPQPYAEMDRFLEKARSVDYTRTLSLRT